MRFFLITILMQWFFDCSGQQTRPSLRSGFYGDNIEVIVNNGTIYGQFEFYEKWNSDINFYEHTCRLYLYGNALSSSDTISVLVGLPGAELSPGKLVLRSDSSFTLFTDFICGYAVDDFSKGYTVSFREPGNAILLGIVKNLKAILYNNPDELSATKSYLVEGDFVSVDRREGEWLLVTYNSPVSGKNTKKWMKDSSLYHHDPRKW